MRREYAVQMTNLVPKPSQVNGEQPPSASLPATELSDLASESMIVSDAHGVIKYWNAASEALYGWPAMAMVGQTYGRRSAHPATPMANTSSALLRESRWEGVVLRRRLAGAEIAAAVRQIVRRDAAGDVLDIVEFGRNAGSLSEAAYLRMDAELQGSLAACLGARYLARRPLARCDRANIRRRGNAIDLDQHPEWVDRTAVPQPESWPSMIARYACSARMPATSR